MDAKENMLSTEKGKVHIGPYKDTLLPIEHVRMRCVTACGAFPRPYEKRLISVPPSPTSVYPGGRDETKQKSYACIKYMCDACVSATCVHANRSTAGLMLHEKRKTLAGINYFSTSAAARLMDTQWHINLKI